VRDPAGESAGQMKPLHLLKVFAHNFYEIGPNSEEVGFIIF
jgi:hypothetical protein